MSFVAKAVLIHDWFKRVLEVEMRISWPEEVVRCHSWMFVREAVGVDLEGGMM